jgi:hypothetical protein
MSIDSTLPRDTCPPTLRVQDLILAVYAPFGTDAVLSGYPDGVQKPPLEHPLIRNLAGVAAEGVEVVVAIDLQDYGTTLVRLPAGQPAAATAEALGRLDMTDPQTLQTLIARARQFAPRRTLVLTMEGHGAGFLPDLDKTAFTISNYTDNGKVQWRIGALPGAPEGSAPFDADGKPLVPEGAPVLPIGGPTLPTNHAAMSTWGIGQALRMSTLDRTLGVPVIHFNNCFNMSVELLHTVAPFAQFATGYCNYNFFTAGEAYPAVFARLAKSGGASSGELARWFAAENHRILAENGHEPTVGGTVELARMTGIAERVDALSDALIEALQQSNDRASLVARIGLAIELAQQYDSRPDYILEVPDELTDLDSLATELLRVDFGDCKIHDTARALRESLAGIKQYGDKGSPWMAPDEVWDFTSRNLAMNIFLPDPMRRGLWDWRSQYYLDVNPDPGKPGAQAHLIDFVKVTDWVDFLVEYHRDTAFVGLLSPMIPDYPIKSPPGANGGANGGAKGGPSGGTGGPAGAPGIAGLWGGGRFGPVQRYRRRG